MKVGRVTYHSSQPWPFPHSQLMIGCFAEVTSTDFKLNEQELEDVRWFSRDDVLAALAQHEAAPVSSSSSASSTSLRLKIPPPFALSHQLLYAWVNHSKKK